MEGGTLYNTSLKNDLITIIVSVTDLQGVEGLVVQCPPQKKKNVENPPLKSIILNRFLLE